MIEVGKRYSLQILRGTEFGLALDDQNCGEVLLPRRYVPQEWNVGDVIDVFIMRDSEDRLTATTLKPRAMAGEFSYLRVVSVTPVGAFLDWGLPKDLLVPFREQKVKLREGQSYVVRIYRDETSDRVVASTNLDKFLDKTPAEYTEGDAASLLIGAQTDLGYKAIINGAHWGMIFQNEVFQPLRRGQRVTGFIKQIRPDGKIDLCLQKPGYEKVPDLADVILNHIKAQGGFMPVTDKNPPEEIYDLFGVSKKTYKKAIGALYKKRLVIFENNGTKLAE